ncbi:hypothetical protein [Nocardia camponoti]|nr:hypothetical protein [Nocardia camponoti]
MTDRQDATMPTHHFDLPRARRVTPPGSGLRRAGLNIVPMGAQPGPFPRALGPCPNLLNSQRKESTDPDERE